MNLTEISEIAFVFIGGLAIFLLGMKNMSDGLQAVLGDSLRKLMSAATTNRFMASGIGTLVTAVIQSSSVTTVMVVGFVNSGFMALSKALAVILGANLGTTVTAWILVLNVEQYGLLILGLAGFVHLFSGKEKARFIAMAVMGVGMIFFGFELMKNGLLPVTKIPGFELSLSWLNTGSYLGILNCALVGCVLTILVRSSSAAVGITMVFAVTGMIGFRTAAAVVLGANIGTTVTALLASIGATTNAKRAANGHVVFNLLGGIWIIALFPVYVLFIRWLLGVFAIDPTQAGHIKTYIAAMHTGFNLTNAIIFLPLIPVIAKFLVRITPKKNRKEVPHLTKLDYRLIETPVIGIEQSRVELLRMGGQVMTMMRLLKTVLDSEEVDDRIVNKVFHRERIMDIMQKEIVTFLADFLSARHSQKYTEEGRLQLRMADEYESVSDYIAGILERYLSMKNEGFALAPENHKEIDELHEALSFYIESVTLAIEKRNPNIINEMYSEGKSIDQRLHELRDRHLTKLFNVRVEPRVNVTYSEMLNAYHRVKDHTLNIAEALAGVK